MHFEFFLFEYFHLILKFKHKIDIRSVPYDLLGGKNQRRRQHRLVANGFLGEKKQEKKEVEDLQGIWKKRKGRREVDVEGHGTAQSGAEMLVPLVVPSKHL